MDQTNSNHQCKKHTSHKLEFVQTKNINQIQDRHLFYCSACINEDLSFKGLDYLLIQQIDSDGENKIIQKWPPIDDQQILEELIKVSANAPSHSTIEQQFINFFNTLKMEISSRIDRIQKNMVSLIKDHPMDGDSILRKYQSISKICEFRKLLLDNNQSTFYAKEQSCREFISRVEENKEQNAQQLLDLLNQSQKKQSEISFEVPNQIKECILTFIDQIDFFNSYKNDQKNNNNNNQPSQEEPNSFSEKIMKLISNKSNYCSDSFLNDVRTKLQKLNPLLESISFEKQFELNKQPIQFYELTNEQLDQIGDQVKHLSQLSRDEEYSRQIKSSLQLKSLKQVLKNQMNFLDNNFITEIERYCIDTYPYLKNVNTENMFTDIDKFEGFNTLSKDIINNIFKLSQKMNRQNDQANNNDNLTLINKLLPTLCEHFYLNKRNDIEDFLHQYPIFELLEQPDFKDIFNEINLEKGKYNQGEDNLVIEKQINQIKISNRQERIANCVSNINLDKDKKYIFRFRVERSNQNYVNFWIGLMKQENINNDYGYNNILCCRLQQDSNQNDIILCKEYGMKKDLQGKGFKVNCSNNEEIELHVCLQEQVLEILDYPNYHYKIQINDSQKQKLLEFNNLRLYIGTCYKEAIIFMKSALIVKEFNN